MKTVNSVLYHGFETLDVFGPVEIMGRLKDHFHVRFYSREGGIIHSSQNVPVMTEAFEDLNPENNILFIPGGDGVKNLVKDAHYAGMLKSFAEVSAYVLTVCTGSILLSKTGLLDGKKATSNKRLFFWTGKESPHVNWVRKARWVKEGKFYTSSGISAGMDMALGFVADLLGYEIAKKQSVEIEYDWKEDKDWDPFSEIYE